MMKLVFQHFLNEGVKELFVKPEGKRPFDVLTISAYDINNLAVRCPHLEDLDLQDFTIMRWPSLRFPWATLQRLVINKASPKCFEDVALHTSAPNIRYFTIGGGPSEVVLPDMRLCSSLQEVYLEEGTFSFPGKIPFPRKLKTLGGSWYARVNWSKDELEIYLENCSICSDLEHWRE